MSGPAGLGPRGGAHDRLASGLAVSPVGGARHLPTRVHLDDPARLAAVRRLLPAGSGNPVVARLSALASHLLGTSSAQVSLVGEATSVVGGHGAGLLLADGPALPRDASLCAGVAARGVPLLVGDASGEDPALARLMRADAGRGARAYLGVPLYGAGGQSVGAVCVYDERPRDWHSRDVMVVEELAEAVSAELERAAVEVERNEAQRVLTAAGRDHEQALVALAASASDALAASLEPAEAVRSLVRLTVPALADWSVVTVAGPRGGLRDVAWWHHDPDAWAATEEFARHRFDGLDAVPGWLAAIVERGAFTLEADVLAAARRMLGSPRAIAALETLAPTSMVVVPIVGSGRVEGSISLFRGGDRPPLSEAEVAAARDVGRRASVALRNARDYSHHRTTSEELQRSLLTAPAQPVGGEVVVRYAPASDAARVGGDWYDAFALPPDEGAAEPATMLVVGDVTGHDVAAAAGMGQVRSILRGLAVTGGLGPAALLDRVDTALDRLRLDVGATALVCRLAAPGGDGSCELCWSGAGHLPALLVHPDGAVELLDGGGVMLGLGAEGLRREQVRRLRPGATLVLFTDGLVERRGEGLDAGLDRLRAAAGPLAVRPVADLVDRLLAQVLPDGHEDDVALLAVRVGAGRPAAAAPPGWSPSTTSSAAAPEGPGVGD